MPERSLLTYEWVQMWFAGLTAMWGGLVSYILRVQSGHVHSMLSIAMHLTSSGFAGLMCWLGCIQFETPPALTAICTGLAGHMGAEFIKVIEKRFENKLTDIT